MDIWYIDIKRFRANNITHRLRWRWPASKTTTSGRGRATVLTDWCHPSAACFAGDSTSTRCQLESPVSRTFHFVILLTKINVIVQFDTRYLRYQSLLSKISKISDIHHIFLFLSLRYQYCHQMSICFLKKSTRIFIPKPWRRAEGWLCSC